MTLASPAGHPGRGGGTQGTTSFRGRPTRRQRLEVAPRRYSYSSEMIVFMFLVDFVREEDHPTGGLNSFEPVVLLIRGSIYPLTPTTVPESSDPSPDATMLLREMQSVKEKFKTRLWVITQRDEDQELRLSRNGQPRTDDIEGCWATLDTSKPTDK
ncbi:hypothetical protein WN55_10626 [Dufourea novaeangliae]|uniref:Uncharacterized protein n=1 Tax=Dufourea novaeangliae TaxID=178035 RepID=A0A154P4F9_DUFNO|nr:hypothetical protein WN55_10626 [Dufourea novaeangliae]